MFQTYWTLGGREAADALAIRREVLMEQPDFDLEQAFDEKDAVAAHLVILVDGVPIASSRMYPHGDGLRIDSASVKKQYRGQGYGDLLVRVMLDKAQRMGAEQVYALVPERFRGYYEAFGFKKKKDCRGNGQDSEFMCVIPAEINWHPGCGQFSRNAP